MENTNNSIPTYTNMLQEIGRQLNTRKSQIFKRITLITWPYILLVVVGYIANSMYDVESLFKDNTLTFVIALVSFLLLAGIYSMVIRFIFNIEKQIWIDSHFDGRELDSKESWNISVKLFWPAMWFRLKLFWKYFFLPLVAIILSIIVSSSIISKYENMQGSQFWVLVSIPFVLIIAASIYSYYIRIKLRYTWFVFLDTFGSGYSFTRLIEEINKLNDVSKTETFKKSLLVNLGTDTVQGVTSVTLQGITSGISMLGNSGQLVGGLLKVYGNEANRQITDIANISSQYLLYRFARKALYGQEQTVNDSIYNMK